jgi:hypothetical protein
MGSRYGYKKIPQHCCWGLAYAKKVICGTKCSYIVFTRKKLADMQRMIQFQSRSRSSFGAIVFENKKGHIKSFDNRYR